MIKLSRISTAEAVVNEARGFLEEGTARLAAERLTNADLNAGESILHLRRAMPARP